jgi:hypothetical protein
MPSLSASEAKACIDRAIRHQLLLAMEALLQSGSSQKEPQVRGVSRQIRKALLADPRVVESPQVLLADRNGKRVQWLTAEQAASMMGFSLPYASALFDSSEFEGKVNKSAGGHRCILACAVRDWMHANGVNFPLTPRETQALEKPVPAEFFDESSALSQSEETRRRQEIFAVNKRAEANRPRSR